MRVAILSAAVLFLACGSSSEDPEKGTRTPSTEPAPAKPESPAEPAKNSATEPTVNVDCAALVTADDLLRACNATLEVSAHALEGKGAGTRCARTISAPGSKAPLVHVALSVFANREAAERFATLDKDVTTTSIEGLGDRAWKKEKEMTSLKISSYDVDVIKGNLLLKVAVRKRRSNPDPPCTLDQLAELAKLITPRLP